MNLLFSLALCCQSLLLLPTATWAWTRSSPPTTSTYSLRPSRSLPSSFVLHQTHPKRVRDSVRSITGLSLTAVRATARAATGISLTAIYASTLAATSLWIRQTMKWILSLVPPPLRYFAQPFLVLYYAPLFWIRQVSHNGARRKNQKGTHEHLLDGWKQAVVKADETVSYWPIHVSQDGNLESDLSEMDVSDAISESIEVSYGKISDTS